MSIRCAHAAPQPRLCWARRQGGQREGAGEQNGVSIVLRHALPSTFSTLLPAFQLAECGRVHACPPCRLHVKPRCGRRATCPRTEMCSWSRAATAPCCCTATDTPTSGEREAGAESASDLDVLMTAPWKCLVWIHVQQLLQWLWPPLRLLLTAPHPGMGPP